MKKKFKLFCFGFGQVAKYFVNKLLDKKVFFDLITTNTTKTELKKIDKFKYKSYFFYNDKFDNDILKDLKAKTKGLDEDLIIKNYTEEIIKTQEAPDGAYTVGDKIVIIQDKQVIAVE